MSKFEYLKLADAVAAEIVAGTLKPGDRLPPQRSFAYERKIAVSTASRVYTELLRRGLVFGEVGRGTFIADGAPRGFAAPTEPRGARIDLEIKFDYNSANIAKAAIPDMDNLGKALTDPALKSSTFVSVLSTRMRATYLDGSQYGTWLSLNELRTRIAG